MYRAVFMDRSVSDSYATEESLRRHNDFRWHNRFRVLNSSSENDMLDLIKEALRHLPAR